MNGAKDPAFSKKLAARGWVGMSLPERYGGRDRSAVDRFIVTEEVLRWGAPIGHHWVADRQTAQMILRFGTEEQRQRFLPGIACGELSFCIGMSEPDSGSDLASVSTKAVRDGDGWRVSGTKIWTTLGSVNDWIVVLCRTTPVADAGDKRKGLSRLLVDLRSPGVTITAIPFIDGTADFAEVVFDDVFVPDDLFLGQPGDGWAQNTSELAFERGGPDRWLSTYLVVEELVRRHEGQPVSGEIASIVGDAAAHYWLFHNLSLSVARAIDRGMDAVVEAALVKEMATRFEQDVLEAVLAMVGEGPSQPARSLFEELLVTATLTAPSFTIRGGTNEILRSIVAKAMR